MYTFWKTLNKVVICSASYQSLAEKVESLNSLQILPKWYGKKLRLQTTYSG